jgi:beta-lactamase class A
MNNQYKPKINSRTKYPAPSHAKSRRAAAPAKIPPGQRLIRYFGLAAVIVLLQSWSFFHGQLRPAPGQQTSVSIAEPLVLTAEQTDIEEQLKTLVLSKPLRIGVFAIEPKTGRYIDVQGKGQFAAASIIKVPILVSLLQAIDMRALKTNQMLTIKRELITGGSGQLQWRPVGTKISLQEAAKLMIVYSDNTATNMIIDVLGGKGKLNEDFVNWGLKQTKLHNWLGDFEGTNKTSAYDLVYLLSRIDRGELISKTSRQWLYDLMAHARVRTLLLPGLGPGARLAHKTGDIGRMVGDTGIVTTSDGNKYFVAMLVERPHNDLRANEFIRNASQLVYTRFASLGELTHLDNPNLKALPQTKG